MKMNKTQRYVLAFTAIGALVGFLHKSDGCPVFLGFFLYSKSAIVSGQLYRHAYTNELAFYTSLVALSSSGISACLLLLAGYAVPGFLAGFIFLGITRGMKVF